MIKLSRLTDYAVMILAEMARDERGALLSAATLAARSGVNEPTVAKIMKLLAKTRILESVRGVSGGYRLHKEVSAIHITEIITAVDGPIALTACIEGSGESCSFEKTCSIKGRWDPVNEALRKALETVTLADMI